MIGEDGGIDRDATEKLRAQRREDFERGEWRPPISYYRDWPVTGSEYEHLLAAQAPAGKEVAL